MGNQQAPPRQYFGVETADIDVLRFKKVAELINRFALRGDRQYARMVFVLTKHFVGDGQLVDRKGRYLVHLQFDHSFKFFGIGRRQFDDPHQKLRGRQRNRHNAAEIFTDMLKDFGGEQRSVFLLEKAFRNRQGTFPQFFGSLVVFTQHRPLDEFVGVVDAGRMGKEAHHSTVFPSDQNRGMVSFSPSIKMQEIWL